MVDFDQLIREDDRPAPTDLTELFRSLLSADRFPLPIEGSDPVG